tara:strand:+ start:3229 stop:4116 length:888 start_codon:yes stop_codon:yes gene_type:complete
MKIIDCFMYFDEDMVLDIRLNTLSKYVSNFLICEASYNHSGSKKKLKFDIKKYTKFKDKIIYIPLEQQPENLHVISSNDTQDIKNSKILDNSLFRENFQRNFLQTRLSEFQDDDLICISDLDEIPNFKNFKYKNKITLFEQKMFYYKFNLIYPNFKWIGSKLCKKKDLISPQWLRNIKSKKYPLWRIDTIFSKKKYSNINFIKDGGWHFTNIKKPEDLDYKMKSFLHHLEYEESGLNAKKLKRIIDEKKVMYDHSVDQRKNKWNAQIKLSKVDENLLPDYIKDNKDKFVDWLDIS